MNFIKKIYCRLLWMTGKNKKYMKLIGIKYGENLSVQNNVTFDVTFGWLLTIGNNVTIAPRAYLLCHDASTKRELGYTRIGKIEIGNNVFIGANTMIMPNVKIGNDVIIGAFSVVTHDVPNNSLTMGIPCKVIKSYQEYIEEQKLKMANHPKFNSFNTDIEKQNIIEKLSNGYGYIK